MDVYLGAQFDSYKDFTMKFHMYCKSTGQAFRIEWSRTVDNYNKTLEARRTPEKKRSPILPVDPSWRYTHLNYVCVHGGKHRLYRAKQKNPSVRAIAGVCPANMLVAYKRNRGKFVVVRANFAHNHGIKTPMGYVPKEDVVAYLTNTPAIRSDGHEGMEGDDDEDVSGAPDGGPSEIFCTVEVGSSDAEQGEEGKSEDEETDEESSGVGGSSKGKVKLENTGERRGALKTSNAGKGAKVKQKGVKMKGVQKLAPIKISGKVKEGLEKSAKSRRLQKPPMKYSKEENMVSMMVSTSKDSHDSGSSPVRVPFFDLPREIVTISARDPDEEELGLVSERCSMNPIDPEKAEILGTAVEALTAHLKQSEQWTGTDDWYFKNLLARLNLPLTSCWVD